MKVGIITLFVSIETDGSWGGWNGGADWWGAGRGYWGIAASIPPPDLTYICSSSLENRVIRPSEWLRYYPLLIRPSLNLT